jgi:phosphatidylinositol alpha-1,6-mannosyltransferase
MGELINLISEQDSQYVNLGSWMKHSILYIATDVFAKGGIQRYSRAQISAARELFPEMEIKVFSLWPPTQNSFEDSIKVDFSGAGINLFQKVFFSLYSIFRILVDQPGVVWINHIRLLPIAYLGLLFSAHSRIILNIYGLEIWSGLRYLEKKALKKPLTIISDSHFSAKYFQEKYGIDQDQLHVIWDPVDTERFAPRRIDKKTLFENYQIPFSQTTLTIMILGRISIESRHKGYDRLIDLMADLREYDIQLLICGDGDDRSNLENKVVQQGLEDRIHFTGSIPEDDLVNIYQLADIFVLVSDRGINRGEGVPLTPLEAAACGKPIIVGNEDGSQEAVREGINGYIVSPREPTQLKERILELYHHPTVRETMGEEARKVILEDFSYDMFKTKLSRVLYKVIGSNNHPG